MERTAVAVEGLVTLKGVLQMVTMVEGKKRGEDDRDREEDSQAGLKLQEQ